MDYDNPQFVAAVKKIVNNLISAFRRDAIQNDDTQQKADAKNDYDEPRIISAELRTPVPISVKNEPQDRHPNWERAKTTAEIVGILAALLYAYVAVRQWREMISARHQAQGAINAAFISAQAAEKSNEANEKRFRLDERAYVIVRNPVLSGGPLTQVIARRDW